MRRAIHKMILLPLFLLISQVTAFADHFPVQASQTGSRTVQLIWEAGSGTTEIYRQYPGENQLVLIGSTESNIWTDHQSRAVCCDTVYYEVRRASDTGSAEVVVCDNEPTSPAQWGVVSVDQGSQHITLQWTASQDNDIMGYMICEGTPSIAIDTVYGRTNTNYTFLLDTCIYVHQFRICAFDSCRRASALTPLCNNIVVILENEPCSRSLTATWNSYQNMPSEVGRYELWVSQDDAPFVIVGQQAGQSTESIVFTVSEECQSVQAYIKAVSTDGTLIAYSNCTKKVFATSERPEFLYLRKVSVDDNCNVVTVVGETDATWIGHEYKVYRSVGDGAAREIGRCFPTAAGQLIWQDKGVEPKSEIYTYYFGVVDGCGRNEMFSEKGNTIKPIIQRQGGNTDLVWNAYEGWEGTTMYSVYMCPVGSELWQLAGSTTDTRLPNITSDAIGQCQYKVAAFEGPDSRYKLYDSVQSVPVIYRPHIEIWMPNSFTPLESSNKSIGPIAAYINPEGYSFSIYNRQGLMMFSTTTPNENWDGTYKGHLQPFGAYTYIVKYRQSDGSMQQMVGTILLIY